MCIDFEISSVRTPVILYCDEMSYSDELHLTCTKVENMPHMYSGIQSNLLESWQTSKDTSERRIT